jgi:hypothetical protein
MSASDPACKYGLRDYYIMSASNACSGGAMSNDYVDVCNLKSVLRQGCRGIDLEIYNIGGKPVVSTGTNGSNYYVKNTLNFVSFDDVMSVLKNYGFSAAAGVLEHGGYIQGILVYFAWKGIQLRIRRQKHRRRPHSPTVWQNHRRARQKGPGIYKQQGINGVLQHDIELDNDARIAL